LSPEQTDATARSADVKKSHGLAALAAVLSLYIVYSVATAQAPAGAAPGQSPAGARMALLDVSRLFKFHPRFKGMMEDMKADVQRAEEQVRKDKEAITKLGERLQDLHKGTPDYQALEEELARRQADLSVKVRLQQGEFLQREAKIYHNVYQEIWQATDYFCKQHGIDMVLRFSSEKVNPDQADSVLATINRPVVWYDQGLDITDNILQELNRTAINPAAADRRGGAAPQPQQRPFSPFGAPQQR
jgi:Skp family chaperone for outer membrane proteins